MKVLFKVQTVATWHCGKLEEDKGMCRYVFIWGTRMLSRTLKKYQCILPLGLPLDPFIRCFKPLKTEYWSRNSGELCVFSLSITWQARGFMFYFLLILATLDGTTSETNAKVLFQEHAMTVLKDKWHDCHAVWVAHL